MKLIRYPLGLATLASAWVAPAAAAELSGEAGIVSDYRYRGFSLSDGKPAAQASITVEHDSGAYATLWTSTIDEPGFDADVEIDLTGGYAFDLADDLGLDLSTTYYVYPAEPGSNYVEASAVLERSKGPATLTAGFCFVPKQGGTRDEDGAKRSNSYLFAAASYEIEKLPLTLSAQIGHERGFFDEVEQSGKWDWGLGASLKLDNLRLGLAYSGTDAGRDGLIGSLFFDF